MSFEKALELARLGYGRRRIMREAGVGENAARRAIERERFGYVEPPAKPEATFDECVADLKRLQEANPERYISRNFYRVNGSFGEDVWGPHFGTFQEFRRQAGLEYSRYQHQIEKQIAKHVSLDHYRKFFRQDVQPYVGLYKREDRVKGIATLIACSDIHDLEADPFALAIFLATCRRVQPEKICLNGDIWDLYEFSRFNIDPRQANVKARFAFVRERVLAPLRAACPDAEIVINLGNHEWRLLKLLADATPQLKVLLSDVVGLTIDDIFGVKEYEITINCKWDLAAFQRADIKEQVRQNYVVFWDTFVCSHIKDYGFGLSGTNGHTHRPAVYTDRNLASGPINWTVTGSICRGNAEYVEGLDKSSQGFAIFHIMPEKKIVQPENIIIQGDFAAVGGIYYHRTDYQDATTA